MFYIPKKIALIFLGLMLLFTLHRLLFILYNFSLCSEKGIGLLLESFGNAIPLDVSTACYACILSLILIILQYSLNKKIIYRIHQVYLCTIVFISTLVAVSDLVVYKIMNTKIHFQLLYHLEHPTEVLRSAPTPVFLIGLPFILIFTFFYCKLLFKIYPYSEAPAHTWYFKILASLLSFGILGLIIGAGIRGGFRPIPINESEVYYTRHQALNDAAVNPSWTLMHSYLENAQAGNTNPYIFMDKEKAGTIVKNMYATSDSVFDMFLTTERPNIAFLILESWSADLVSVCGGDKGITPEFDSLSRSGLLFSNAFASGQLSHQGIPAILSAYPSLPITSIIQNSDKFPRISCINRELKKEGYNSSFYYGGQLIYGNIKRYLFYNQFDEIKEESDFSTSKRVRGKLGIHDEQMFMNWMDAINKKQEPFFTCLFTLSSHPPYDMPMKEKPPLWEDNTIKYVNSVHYADSCLGSFFREAKLQPWYKNTLFVLVADHGNFSPRKYANNSVEHNHIPLLIFGDVLKENYRGKVITHIASQTDIAATVLSQLKIPHQQYRWSKNLFDSLNAFAFFTYYEGYGLTTPKGKLVWDKKAGGIYITNTFSNDDFIIFKAKGEAYLQELSQEYLDF
ncbi:MAG: LTA synthase family protein [Chitinophagales bacterium]